MLCPCDNALVDRDPRTRHVLASQYSIHPLHANYPLDPLLARELTILIQFLLLVQARGEAAKFEKNKKAVTMDKHSSFLLNVELQC